MGKPKRPRPSSRHEAKAVVSSLRVSPAETEPGRGDDPRQEGQHRDRRTTSFHASASPMTCESACRRAVANAENNHHPGSGRSDRVGGLRRQATRDEALSCARSWPIVQILKPFSMLTVIVKESRPLSKPRRPSNMGHKVNPSVSASASIAPGTAVGSPRPANTAGFCTKTWRSATMSSSISVPPASARS